MLALIPVLLDLLLLATPGVRSETLTSQAHGLLSRMVTEAPADPESLLAAGEQLGQVQQSIAAWNLLAVLAWQVPTLTGPITTVNLEDEGHTALQGLGEALWLLAGLAAGSLALATLFLTRLAAAVRQLSVMPSSRPRTAPPGDPAASPLPQPPSLPNLADVKRLALNFLNMAGLRIIQGLLLLLVGALAVVLVTIGGGTSTPLVFVAALAALAVLVFLFLAEEALFVDGLRAWAAVRASVRVVRAHFVPSLGLWVLLGTIGVGLRLVWLTIAGSTLGALLAMVGNGYIVTSLTTAALVFYYDRKAVRGP